MFAISNVVPHVASLLEAYATLKTLRAAIERTPKIDVRDNAGVCLPDDGDWEPGFELKNVVFAYPSRPNVATLNDVSLKLPAGKVTALVGPSGSGKSTIANLLLREYDPETANVPSASDEAEAAAAADSDKKRADGDVTDAMDRAEKDEKTDEEKRVAGSGHVLFAGNDVRELNLRWLRAQVAVVPQHPHIFSGLSVWENVALGLSGTSFAYRPGIDDVADDEKAKDRLATIREMCCSALEKAQALDFVQQLPDGMDTAARGLSGGQAQRVAIARALVRQPKILCLDEGTSALDTATEERLKVALQKEQESRGMTMVVVAHRLSTIQHADSVTVMKNGRIVDQGTHSELLEPGRPDSTFKTMWLTQSGLTELDDDTDTDTDSIASLDGKDKDEKHMMRLQQSTTESPSGPSSEEATRVDGQSTRLNSAAGHLTAPHRPEPQPVVTSATTSNSTSRSTYQVSGRTLTIGQLEHSAESSYAAPARLGAGQSSVGSIADEDTDGAGNDFPPLRKRQLFGNLKAYVGPQWWYFFVGFIGAVASGASFPVAGWLTGEAVQALSIQGDNSRLRSEANDWALYFFILALVDLLIIFVNSFFLELGAEKIVRRMKVNGLKALIKQEIGWHDRDENASGSLTSAVTSHPSAVGLASGIVLSTVSGEPCPEETLVYPSHKLLLVFAGTVDHYRYRQFGRKRHPRIHPLPSRSRSRSSARPRPLLQRLAQHGPDGKIRSSRSARQRSFGRVRRRASRGDQNALCIRPRRGNAQDIRGTLESFAETN